jgi:flagella synthesis protein FlgN
MAIVQPNATLLDEQQLLSSLIALMKEEQEHLVRADTDGLAQVTLRKTQLAGEVAMLSKQRHIALHNAGFAAGEAGMAPWLAASGNEEARAQWEALLEVTREAKELNRVNGLLVNKQLARNQTLISAMRTPATGGDAGLYGRTGLATASGASRRFVIG